MWPAAASCNGWRYRQKQDGRTAPLGKVASDRVRIASYDRFEGVAVPFLIFKTDGARGTSEGGRAGGVVTLDG